MKRSRTTALASFSTILPLVIGACGAEMGNPLAPTAVATPANQPAIIIRHVDIDRVPLVPTMPPPRDSRPAAGHQ